MEDLLFRCCQVVFFFLRLEGLPLRVNDIGSVDVVFLVVLIKFVCTWRAWVQGMTSPRVGEEASYTQLLLLAIVHQGVSLK